MSSSYWPTTAAALHFNVNEFPSAAWTVQQIVEAFPEDTAPRFLIRDRDGIFGRDESLRVAGWPAFADVAVEGNEISPRYPAPGGRS